MTDPTGDILARFVGDSPSSLALFDTAMRYIAASERWRVGFGLSEPFVGRSHFELFPTLRQYWKDIFVRGLAGETLTHPQDPFRRPDGRVVWLKWEVRPWRDAAGAIGGVFASAEYITDRVESEAALRQSEARYRLLADNASDIVTECDLEGRFTYVSPAVKAVTGYRASEVIGAPALDFVHPDDRERVRLEIGLSIQAPTGVEIEYRHVRKDGRVIWLQVRPRLARDPATGRAFAITDVIRDVTERHATQAAIALSEANYRLLADNLTDVIACCDLKGRLTYVSPSAERVFGYRPEDIIGASTFNLVHPDDQRMVAETMTAFITAAQPDSAARMEYRLTHKSGRIIWIEANPTLLFDPETGRVNGLQDCSRDITERKAMEVELEQRRIEAEAAAVAKTEFLANMSHEVRTPLTGVLGFASLLQATPGLPAKAQTYADRIVTSGQTLLSVVNDILDFSKLDAARVDLDPQPFDPTAMITDTLDLVAAEAGRKDLALAIRFDGDLPAAVNADSARIRQVLLNLLTNAIKFTQQGGVTVTATYISDDNRLHMSVTDTGAGIAPESIERLFKRFSQVDGSNSRQHGGTGLGLAISEALVALMNGRIGVDSRLGEGSTFWFTVAAPIAERVAPAAVEAELQFSASGPTILVVDDVTVNRELVRAMLSPFGFEISEAANGAEAVATALARPFDLILMDLQMPGMDGLAATRAIRKACDHNRATPILALSANVLPAQVSECRDAGMNDHIAKPIMPAELLTKISAWIRAAEAEPALA